VSSSLQLPPCAAPPVVAVREGAATIVVWRETEQRLYP
jgi:hypothetical protein